MFHQGHGVAACRGGLTLLGRVAAEQQRQGSGQLFRTPARPLPLEGVPVAVADAELPLQGHRQLQGPGGPGRCC
jgi:hypothetical protein